MHTVFKTELATDLCVARTAMEARKAGFEAYVIEGATRLIDLDGSLAAKRGKGKSSIRLRNEFP